MGGSKLFNRVCFNRISMVMNLLKILLATNCSSTFTVLFYAESVKGERTYNLSVLISNYSLLKEEQVFNSRNTRGKKYLLSGWLLC